MSDKPLTELEKRGLARTLGAAVALVDYLIKLHKLDRKQVVYGAELANIKLEQEKPDAPRDA
jgi:hypothetical protein